MKWNIWSQLEMASQTKYSLRSKESFIPTVACVTWPDLSPGLFVPGVVISDSKPVVTQATVGIKLSLLLKEYLVCDAISSCDQMFHFIHCLKFIFSLIWVGYISVAL